MTFADFGDLLSLPIRVCMAVRKATRSVTLQVRARLREAATSWEGLLDFAALVKPVLALPHRRRRSPGRRRLQSVERETSVSDSSEASLKVVDILDAVCVVAWLQDRQPIDEFHRIAVCVLDAVDLEDGIIRLIVSRRA